jgi:hypothetical protein
MRRTTKNDFPCRLGARSFTYKLEEHEPESMFGTGEQ